MRALTLFVCWSVFSSILGTTPVQALSSAVQAVPLYSFVGSGLAPARVVPSFATTAPGLLPGGAQQTPALLSLEFPYLHENPVFLDGRAVRLPVQSGADNAGTLSLLLDATVSADFGGGQLKLTWKGQLRNGERVRIGEALLALQKKPASGVPISDRVPAPALDESIVYAAANGMGLPPLDLAPAGYIVRVPVFMENRADRVIHLSLGAAPETVAGKLLDAVPSDSLRYVSSDTPLPDSFVPTLSWSRDLSCIRNRTAYAFHGETLSGLRAMLKAAAAKGVMAYDLSNSYRSAAHQRQLFDRRYALSKMDPSIADPLAATLRRVTRPNGSEHQTGMAMDIFSTTTRETAFAKTVQYAFIRDQGWKFGFVVRYPDGMEHKTRIMFEPWHIRWFDLPVAAWLHRENRVYEEFTSTMRLQGAVWLGETGLNQTPAEQAAGTAVGAGIGMGKTVWLAVMATPDAEFATAISSQAPERSHFLPNRHVWLIPMGAAGNAQVMGAAGNAQVMDAAGDAQVMGVIPGPG